MVTLAQAVAVLYPNAVPLVEYTVTDHGVGAQLTQWDTGALGAQPSPATLAAVTEAQVASAVTATARTVANTQFLATEAGGKVLRALAAVLLDEINIIRAALPSPLPARTLAQAKTAITNKLNSGAVD